MSPDSFRPELRWSASLLCTNCLITLIAARCASVLAHFNRGPDDYMLFMTIFGIPVEFQYYAGGEAPETPTTFRLLNQLLAATVTDKWVN